MGRAHPRVVVWVVIWGIYAVGAVQSLVLWLLFQFGLISGVKAGSVRIVENLPVLVWFLRFVAGSTRVAAPLGPHPQLFMSVRDTVLAGLP